MLRPRLIPFLLVKDGGVVKTIKFGNDQYIGDPLNAIKIFNEKCVDELVLLDIDATTKNRDPDYKSIHRFAAETRMPFCYGGGIKNVAQAKKIINLGVEKVAISSAIIERPQLAAEISDEIGKQSLVAVLDIKTNLFGDMQVYVNNGKKKVNVRPLDLIDKLQNYGVGEIVLNSINDDGVMKGYNLKLIEQLIDSINVPSTFIGGAGKIADFSELVAKFGVVGCGAGSLFVFKGKFKAVLINYPTFEERKTLFQQQINP